MNITCVLWTDMFTYEEKWKKKCIASIILYSRTSSTWFHLRISIFESFKNIFTRHKNLHRFCICWAYNFLFSSEGIYGWINTNYSMFFIGLLGANKIWFSLLNWKTITSYTEIVTQKVIFLHILSPISLVKKKTQLNFSRQSWKYFIAEESFLQNNIIIYIELQL